MTMIVKTVKIGQCEIDIGPDRCLTRFPDGTEVRAHPNYTAEDLARALALGYSDELDPIASMTRDHDVLHALLADARGWRHSNVAWALAHGESPGPGGDDEERIVLLLHHLARRGVRGVLDDRSVHIPEDKV